MTDNRRKHLEILKNLSSGDKVRMEMAQRAMRKFEEAEQEAFTAFQVDVGALFEELKEELDKGLEELADVHPEEPDPRKWDFADWFQFHQTTQHHKFYEIYTLMGQAQPNIHLIWKELENRIFVS